MKTCKSKQWYVVTSKPRKDAEAETQLTNQGYTVYRPLAKRLRKQRNKMVTSVESLFPCYLFIELDQVNDNWGPIRSTRGVNNIVRFGNEPAAVPHELIQQLRIQEDNLSERAIDLDRFHTGDEVLIHEGPFKGLTGIFAHYDGEQRSMILLTLLQQKPTKLAIDTVHIKAA